jgi:predicted Zn-dependent protease
MFSVNCDKCGTQMVLDEARVPPSGMVKKCSHCFEPVTVMPPPQGGARVEAAFAAAKPMPPRPASKAPPIPGAAATRAGLGPSKGPALAAFEDSLELEPSELVDLPAPAARQPGGRTRAFGSDEVDLPAPVLRGADMPDLLAPVGGGAGGFFDDGVVDLPAPVTRGSDLPDLLAPVGPSGRDLPDLLAPVGPSGRDLPDLLAPVGPSSRDLPDLLAPVGPSGGRPDLLSPVGPTATRIPDLLAPVGPTASRAPDLLTPVGPTASRAPDLLSPVGPNPTRGVDLPAPKGFLDDAPPPAYKHEPSALSLDALDFNPGAGTSSGPPNLTSGGAGMMVGGETSDGLDMLDLAPPGDGGKSGPGSTPDLLSFDAPGGGVPLPPATGGVVSFGKVEPRSTAGLSLGGPAPASPAAAKGGAAVLDLDTASDPVEAARAAKKVAQDRDDKQKAKQAAAAVDDPAAKARAKKRRMTVIAAIGVLVIGGGGFYYFKSKADERAEVQAQVTSGVSEAKKALGLGDWSHAFTSAQRAIAASGTSAEAIGLAAQAQLAWAVDTGRDVPVHRKLADELLKHSLTSGLSGPEIERARALLLLVDARPTDAMAAAGKLHLTDPMGALYHGWIALAAGDASTAKGAFTVALAGRSGKDANRAALYGLARAKLALGDAAGAEAAFDELLKASPGHVGALVGKAALIPRDRSGTREKRLMEILGGGDLGKASPSDIALAWTLAGQEALYARRWDDAEVRFKKAEATVPDAIDAIVGRGLALYGKGNLAEAKSTLESIRTRAPDQIDAMLGLGQIARAEGRVNDAKDLLTKVAKLRPDDTDVQYELGEILVAANDPSGALAAYEKSVSIDKSNYKAVVALANLQNKQGQPEKAIQTLQLIEKEAQGDAFLSNTLAIAYFTSGRNNDAETWARAALTAEPSNVDAQLTLASVLEKKGDEVGALAALEAGHNADPAREDVSLRLARA